jgi:hypothetical protein
MTGKRTAAPEQATAPLSWQFSWQILKVWAEFSIIRKRIKHVMDIGDKCVEG